MGEKMGSRKVFGHNHLGKSRKRRPKLPYEKKLAAILHGGGHAWCVHLADGSANKQEGAGKYRREEGTIK